MKRTLYIFLLGLLLFGCRNSGVMPYDPIPAGQTSVALTLINAEQDDPWDRPTKALGLTTVQEQTIARLDILVFNAGGILVSRTTLTNPSLAVAHHIATQSGPSMSIYAIANATAQAAAQTPPYDMLAAVSSIADLENIRIYSIDSDLAANGTLVMYGSLGGVALSASPAANNVTIPLNYVAAKVRVHIVSSLPNGESFTLTDWSVQNSPIFSYLLPRTADAVSTESDYTTTSSAGSTWQNKSDILMADGSTKSGQATVFYTYENRRGTLSNSNPMQKTGLAPPRATAVVVRGYYRTASSVDAVVATVALGSNSTNDYNILRTNQYTYVVEIKGFNNISVDTRYTSGNAGFKAELLNPVMDAHYDWRPLRIGSWAGTASIDILDGSGNAVSAGFWLKMSVKDIIHFVGNGSGGYIRPTYTPATDMVSTLSGITFSNPSAMSYNTYYLYADEYLVVGGLRTAQVRITNTQSALIPAQSITLTVSQKGIQTMGGVGMRVMNSAGIVSTTTYTLGVENQEEASLYTTPGNSANENTKTMQWWGAPTVFFNASASTAYLQRMGSNNTIWAVLSGGNSSGSLRAPYGRTGSATITEALHDPIFNSYAARYCFEKNRDTDGNGTTTGNEIKWYLPSTDELLLIYVGLPSLSPLAGEKMSTNPYWSSTQIDANNAVGLHFGGGAAYASTAKSTAQYVRCVRAM